MIILELWQKIGLYLIVLLGLFIYVKLSNLKINNAPLLKKEYRILLAVFFPVIAAGAVLIGSVILALALVIVSLIGIYSFITKKKIHISFQRAIPRKPLN